MAVSLTVRQWDKPLLLDVRERGGAGYDEYTGEYTVTPGNASVVLETKNKVLLDKITVNPIPSNYGLITYNGYKLTVS